MAVKLQFEQMRLQRGGIHACAGYQRVKADGIKAQHPKQRRVSPRDWLLAAPSPALLAGPPWRS